MEVTVIQKISEILGQGLEESACLILCTIFNLRVSPVLQLTTSAARVIDKTVVCVGIT